MVDVGLIFGMIIAIMVITLVFVFGYQQLTGLQDVQNSAEMIKAKGRLVVAVDRVYSGGGESSGSIELSFPSSVARVCFIPLFHYYEDSKEAYTASELQWQLEDQGLAQESNAKVIAQRRDTAKQADGIDYNVLVFFMESEDPAWYAIEHLEPSEMEDATFLCAGPKETVWLQRKFDNDGAWVDAEEA
jgi:hypothetical protein